MIHFKNETKKGFEYYFTKGISGNDIDILLAKVQTFVRVKLPEKSIQQWRSTEYYPSTKKYSNVYTAEFLSEEQWTNLKRSQEATIVALLKPYKRD